MFRKRFPYLTWLDPHVQGAETSTNMTSNFVDYQENDNKSDGDLDNASVITNDSNVSFVTRTKRNKVLWKFTCEAYSLNLFHANVLLM